MVARQEKGGVWLLTVMKLPRVTMACGEEVGEVGVGVDGAHGGREESSVPLFKSAPLSKFDAPTRPIDDPLRLPQYIRTAHTRAHQGPVIYFMFTAPAYGSGVVSAAVLVSSCVDGASERKYMPQLKSLVALVSGGASGLGAGTARRFARQGAKVVIADLNGDAAKTLAEEIGANATYCAADCTSAADVAAALDLCQSAFGDSVGACVHTAGTLHAGKIVHTKKGTALDLEPFERVLRVNVLGSFNVARLAAERMAKREPNDLGERGVLIQTASIAAFDGQAGQIAYSASKGALVGMTLPMARDLAPLGIRVATIAPGIFETPMMAAAPDNVRESLAAQIPFPSRFGAPDEFAAFCQTIVENAYINGETFRLDGAVRMGAT